MKVKNSLPSYMKIYVVSKLQHLFLLLCLSTSGLVLGQQVSINATQPTANEAGLVAGEFTISVTGASVLSSPLQVFLSVIPGSSATSGADYLPLPASVNVPISILGNGQTTVVLNVIQDFLVEGTEVVRWIIDPDLNYTISPTDGSAQVAILDDDVAGVNVNTPNGTTTESGGVANFIFTLSSQPTADVVLRIDQYDTTETSGPAILTLTNANWNTGVVLTITGVDDIIVDGDIVDQIRVRMDNSDDPNYDSLNDAAVPDIVVTNQDDDGFTATITTTDGTATEAGAANNGEFTVDLGSTNATGSPVIVNFTRAGTATHITDYAAIGASVSVPNGAQIATVVINPVDDNAVEGPETVILTLAPGALYTIGGANSATVTIVDNDSFSATITATDPTATEAGTTNNGEFTVDLGAQNATGSPVVVNFTRAGTATHITDYANIGNSVPIANNQQTNTITINPFNDQV